MIQLRAEHLGRPRLGTFAARRETSPGPDHRLRSCLEESGRRCYERREHTARRVAPERPVPQLEGAGSMPHPTTIPEPNSAGPLSRLARGEVASSTELEKKS